MAEFQLTPEQQAVVDNRGRSLLVSAAAGSGKTKVLVERLFSYIENEGANIDDFLIITFTRAAAAELRGKIAAALSERLEKDPSNAHLRRQMLRVYRADIKTVDAFCAALLRENCHLLPEDSEGRALRPDFRVMDEREAQALKVRVLTRVMESFYEDMDEGRMQLADTLGAGRDDSALAALVLQLHSKLMAQPHCSEWIEKAREQWRHIPERIEQTPYGELLLQEFRAKAQHYHRALKAAVGEMVGVPAFEKAYLPAFSDAADQLFHLAELSEQGWDELSKAPLSFARLGGIRNCEDIAFKNRLQTLWERCKKVMSGLKKTFDVSSLDSARDLRLMSGAMLALLTLTERFFESYQSEKRRRNVMDFADQEHEAIRILLDAEGEPTGLARELSARYREIMVDEYQDTNEVQNCIFRAISRKGKNLFTVGDVKQSIYRFRLADPSIFLEHYEQYPNAAEAAEGESGKLVLSCNFRSRSEVLEATNFVFRAILSREMGELDYGEDESLHYGANYDLGTADDTEFHLLLTDAQEEGGRRSKREIESEFVADYIRKLIDTSFPVQEGKGAFRPVREEDVVILMRNPGKNYELYRRALERRGLHAVSSSEGKDAFYETIEIAVLYALLQVIDNPRQDVPLITVLRSPLFSFTPDDLARVRAKARRGDFYDALKADESEKSSAFLEVLSALREIAPSLSVFELLAHIYDRCGVYAVFGAMPDGALKRENLESFLDIARSFDGGLFDFLCRMKELMELEKAPQPQRGTSASGIRIMSIHKSKGLEFPVVILCDLATSFNMSDYNEAVLVHPKLGIAPVCVDTERSIRYPTQAVEAVKCALKREAKAEEMRILYVAMTRAKEKLVMVHADKGLPKHLATLASQCSYPVQPEVVEQAGSLGDLVLMALLSRVEAKPLHEVADVEVPCGVFDDTPWIVRVHRGDEILPVRSAAMPMAEEEKEEKKSVSLDALSFRYPYEAETKLPAKLTATQLKGREKDEQIAEGAALPPRLRVLRRPRFVSQETALSPTERGTAVHAALQFIDFATPANEEDVRAATAELAERRLLSAEQAQAVDTAKLVRFLRSPLAERLRKAEKVEREYRFFLLDEAKNYDSAVTGDDRVLVQGVVDCFFEQDGELVVVDFKTDRVEGEALLARAEEYRPQLELYAKALSRVLGKRVREKILYFFHTDTALEL